MTNATSGTDYGNTNGQTQLQVVTASHPIGEIPPERYRPTYGDWGPIRVPPDRYFVLGDNRYGSLDSRQRGFIRRAQIVARVRWVFAAVDPSTHRLRLERMGRDVP